MTCTVRLLSAEEYAAKEGARHDAIDAHRAEIGDPLALPPSCYRSNWFAPGDAHFCPWYFDPAKPDDASKREYQIAKMGRGELPSFLSWHYWRDWSEKRPPINVFLPNGEEWLIDQRSTKDELDSGWKVTIDAEGRITCSPSIDMITGKGVRLYHGHLKGGRFTASLDGLPPDGIRRSPP